jgi:ubiquinone/menaquinone biosynthesis C-methylase UbiE
MHTNAAVQAVTDEIEMEIEASGALVLRPVSSYASLVERKRAEFAHLAPQYELQCLVATLGRIGSLRRRLARMAQGAAEGPVLELCCGTGGVTVELGKIFERVIGVDLSPDMLTRARHRIDAADLNDRVELREAEVSTLRFPDASFSAVVISLGLHELPQWIRDHVLCQTSRWLKPGGRFVYCDYAAPRNRIARALFRWIGRLVIEEEHFGEYLDYSLERQLGRHGFQPIERRRQFLSCLEVSAWRAPGR